MTYLAFRHGWHAVLGAALLCLSAVSSQAATEDPVLLAPHRAVYDLTLLTARSSSGVVAVTGRLVYDLTGSVCEGYTQNTRLVTRLTQQSGSASLSDLSSTTWEDAAGKSFRFDSTTYHADKMSESAAGDAIRQDKSGEVKVEISKPEKKSLFLPAGAYFPVQHTIALIKAARAGKTSFRADLYDGSDKGEKVYDTVSALGPPQPAGANRKLPSVAGSDRLDAVRAWPVSIAYFETRGERSDALPVYEVSFWMFENGISRKLTIDYGDFALQGTLKELVVHEPGKCEAK